MPVETPLLPRAEFALLQARINRLFASLLRFDNAVTARRAVVSIAKRDAMLVAFHAEAMEMDAERDEAEAERAGRWNALPFDKRK